MYCIKCKREKEEKYFYIRRTGERRGEFYSRCKTCFRIRGREYYHKNKKRQLPLAIARTRRARGLKRKYIYNAKNRPCADCRVKYPHYVMDFDHRDESDKITDIAQTITKNWSLLKIEREIKKCDVVCANCHRERTYKRNAEVAKLVTAGV